MKNLMDTFPRVLDLLPKAKKRLPHFASECIKDLNKNLNYKWPEVDKKFLEEDRVKIVVQINGKKRAILEENKGINEQTLINKIKKSDTFVKYLKNKNIYKTVLIKDRLINFIIK